MRLKKTLGLSAKAGALNLNPEIINRLPGAVMMCISACTIVLDGPRHAVYYVCVYVQTICGVTEQRKVNMILCCMEYFALLQPKMMDFNNVYNSILIIMVIIIILFNLLGIFLR